MPPNDVSADGKRHLFVKPSKGQATANEINVTMDGAGELQSKVCYWHLPYVARYLPLARNGECLTALTFGSRNILLSSDTASWGKAR